MFGKNEMNKNTWKYKACFYCIKREHNCCSHLFHLLRYEQPFSMAFNFLESVLGSIRVIICFHFVLIFFWCVWRHSHMVCVCVCVCVRVCYVLTVYGTDFSQPTKPGIRAPLFYINCYRLIVIQLYLFCWMSVSLYRFTNPIWNQTVGCQLGIHEWYGKKFQRSHSRLL